MKKISIKQIINFLAVGVLVTLSACSGTGSNAALPTPGAETATKPFISATGVVLPSRWTMLSIPASGVVEEVNGKENQIFNKGDALMRLKGKAAQEAAVSAADVAVLAAQRKLDDLYKRKKNVSGKTINALELQYWTRPKRMLFWRRMSSKRQTSYGVITRIGMRMILPGLEYSVCFLLPGWRVIKPDGISII
jgi:multidrug efflux pump subunit AcrA (membrane-fusion protein)